MNVSSGLTNLNIKTPELLEFDGIQNGKMTKIFGTDAKLSKSPDFKRTRAERVAGKFIDNYNKLRYSHNFRKSLANRRVKILLQNNDNSVNTETQLLNLVDECSNVQKEKSIVDVNPLLKQIRKDICIHLTNEIRKCTSPDKLKQLHERISSLTPTSKVDRSIKKKLDDQSIISLKKELDNQCNRIVDQLKSDFNSKHNSTSDKANLNLKESSTYSAAETLSQECNGIINWTEAIRDISPKIFKDNRNGLCQLLSNTYQSGIKLVTPHPTDLRETKKTLFAINELSEKITKTISSSTDNSQKILTKINNATSKCKNSLQANLEEIPLAADKYQTLLNETKKVNQNLLQIKQELENLNSRITEARGKKKQLTEKINSGSFIKRLLPWLLDRKNHNTLSEIEKTIPKLEKEQDKLDLRLSQTQEILKNTQFNTDSAYNAVRQLVDRYGSSVTYLDGLKHVQVDEKGIPSVDDVLAALQNPTRENTKTIPTTTPTVAIKLSDQFKNNRSISENPEHMQAISSFIDEKLTKNPETRDTLPDFLAIYCELLQPDSDGREWSFEQTFQAFIDSCEKLSAQQDSVEEAQQYLYDTLIIKHSQSSTTQNKGRIIDEANNSDQENLEANIRGLLDDVSEEDHEDGFDTDDKIPEIKELISRQQEFQHLSDQERENAATEIFNKNPNNEEIRNILYQLRGM